MQRLRLLLLPLMAMVLALGGAASPADAKSKKKAKVSNIRVAIGDQSPLMFQNQSWKDLELKRTRYFIPWNALSTDDTFAKDRAIQYVTAAKAAGVSVLLHVSTDNFELKKGKLPSVKEYRTEVRKMVKLFRPLGVKEWGVWNEANHASQPTYKDPKRAAQYFREMYRAVGKKDKIIALDVLDQGGVDKYQQKFYAALSKTYRSRAKYVGLHNYGDVNRKRTKFTSLMMKTSRKYNKRTHFWFTETGGIVEFGKSFKCSESRAASRTKNVLTLAKKFKVERVYMYNFFGPGCGETRMDTGFIAPDGKERKSYDTLKKLLPSYKR